MTNVVQRLWRKVTGWTIPPYVRDEAMPDDEKAALLAFLARNGAGPEVAQLMKPTRGETADAMREWFRTRPKG